MTHDVRLTLDAASYAPGAMVKLTMTNHTSRDLGYNACTRVVEREQSGGGRWAAVPEPDRVCTMEIRTLPANGNVTESTDLPATLEAGRYRLVLNFHDEGGPGGRLLGRTAPFDVR